MWGHDDQNESQVWWMDDESQRDPRARHPEPQDQDEAPSRHGALEDHHVAADQFVERETTMTTRTNLKAGSETYRVKVKFVYLGGPD